MKKSKICEVAAAIFSLASIFSLLVFEGEGTMFFIVSAIAMLMLHDVFKNKGL